MFWLSRSAEYDLDQIDLRNVEHFGVEQAEKTAKLLPGHSNIWQRCPAWAIAGAIWIRLVASFFTGRCSEVFSLFTSQLRAVYA